MKSTLIILLILALAVVFSQYELSLKDNSLIIRYIQPLFYETLETGMELATSSGESDAAPGMDNQAIEVAQLRQVIDGDTIDVFINGEVERIRYIGANTPEFGEACYQ